MFSTSTYELTFEFIGTVLTTDVIDLCYHHLSLHYDSLYSEDNTDRDGTSCRCGVNDKDKNSVTRRRTTTGYKSAKT